ncbi:MAG: S8 family peptidase [Planctomycetes bacterium]|nr:S8 family peptidase [Planctomycetota bacterium]
MRIFRALSLRRDSARARKPSAPRRSRRLMAEPLESRCMLSVTAPHYPIIVALNDNIADVGAEARQLVGNHGQVAHVYQHALKGFSANLTERGIEAIQKNPNVRYTEPDGVMEALAKPGSTSSQPPQEIPTGVDRIEADLNLIADIDKTDDQRVDVDIAIIDTGIDKDHPDLNVFTGRNFTNGPASKWDDGNGHGTHVAGTAAALDNTIGVVGVAPGARLWAVKVLNNGGIGSTADVIKGMDWVTEMATAIEVANMSLGGSYSQAINEAVKRMTDAGVVLVVAAGNDGADAINYSPASAPSAITVSAAVDTDGQAGGLGSLTSYGDDDTLATFSNDGSVIDIAAPGVSIYSTYKDGAYATLSGTSMASPHVAGAAALYIAANGRAIDGAGVAAIRDGLVATGQAMADWRSADDLDTNSDTDGIHEPMVWVG